MNYEEFAPYVAVALITALVAGGAAYTYADNTDTVNALEADLDEANETIEALEADIADYQSTISDLRANVSDYEDKVADLEAQLDAYTEELSYFPGAERTSIVEVRVNEDIDDETTYDLDVEYSPEVAVEDVDAYLHEEYPGPFDEGDSDAARVFHSAGDGYIDVDEEGTYYLEIETEMVDDLAGESDDYDDEEDVLDVTVDLEVTAEQDYYVVAE